MIDRRVEDWCVQAMTVQEFKPRGSAEEQPAGDILSPAPDPLENEKESSSSGYHRSDPTAYQPQDSENLLGRVLAGKRIKRQQQQHKQTKKMRKSSEAPAKRLISEAFAVTPVAD